MLKSTLFTNGKKNLISNLDKLGLIFYKSVNFQQLSFFFSVVFVKQFIRGSLYAIRMCAFSFFKFHNMASISVRQACTASTGIADP